MNNKNIYMDYQSAKPVDAEVIDSMNEYHQTRYGNPSSLHKIGDDATETLDSSRETIAKWIHGEKDEILFTSGATESINLGIIGYALRNKRKGNHIIMSEVEHISLHNIAKYLERNGFQISKVPVDQYGRIKLNKLRSRIKEETILISVQMANNEIGTIQPIKEIGEIAKEKGIAFHTDAVAAEGQMDIDVQANNINLMTLSSNDIYGPRGVGVLYMQKGFRVQPLIIGGGQERGFRSGSENMPGIVGMKKAVDILEHKMGAELERMKLFQKLFIKEILESNPDTYLNGHPVHRLINNSHFRFDGIEGESILLSFKDKNIAVSTGSACSSKTLEPSHTLIATGLLHEEAHGSLELTTGRYTSLEEVKTVIEEVPGIVKRLRDLSPLYKK
ncbi:Cysteine desulfurase IscS 2 [Candidatus Lokiarchaeum ossiferum]|uniref:Cysteine desulfurase IscS 2 n=1 Tax=Candidatus Lokiarchaeum ossiferum TaxID=2951803 RepID=A0ABY6HNV5_9ARCH|nr:Cysteine desulfurase IscS 2 [Candidatus Lokiarchaeum sp. B-35]